MAVPWDPILPILLLLKFVYLYFRWPELLCALKKCIVLQMSPFQLCPSDVSPHWWWHISHQKQGKTSAGFPLVYVTVGHTFQCCAQSSTQEPSKWSLALLANKCHSCAIDKNLWVSYSSLFLFLCNLKFHRARITLKPWCWYFLVFQSVGDDSCPVGSMGTWQQVPDWVSWCARPGHNGKFDASPSSISDMYLNYFNESKYGMD